MKKLWAIICVVGFTAFWTYGFIVVAGLFGDRTSHAVNYVLCVLGLGLGVYARYKIVSMTPGMHRRRAPARARLEEEYEESVG